MANRHHSYDSVSMPSLPIVVLGLLLMLTVVLAVGMMVAAQLVQTP